MTTNQKLIDVLDWLLTDDFLEDLDMRKADGSLKGDLKKAADKLSLLFRLTHGMNENHSCYYVHKDWRKEFQKVYKQMVKEKK